MDDSFYLVKIHSQSHRFLVEILLVCLFFSTVSLSWVLVLVVLFELSRYSTATEDDHLCVYYRIEVRFLLTLTLCL